MGQLIVTVVLGISTFGAIVFVGLRLGRSIERKTEMLSDTAAVHGKRLVLLAAELQYARTEVARMHCELADVRRELKAFIHGPPSMTRPVS